MEQELLYKMFKGEATDGELAQIRSWVNAGKANKEALFRERALFDAIQLNASRAAYRADSRSLTLWRRIGSVAAAIAGLLLTYNISLIVGGRGGEEMAFNTIKVPAGQQVEVTLSDGTHVWLNARSELSYPVSFGGDAREVRLRGEAFFDVAKHTDKRFVVSTGRCDVEVLGTEFDVEAYSENEFSTALIRGSVKVTDKARPDHPVVLKPNNKVTLRGGKLTVAPITDLSQYSWREGLITFKDIKFRDLMVKLEKCFDVRIIIEGSRLDDYVCSGKFRISDGVEQMLRALQQDAHFAFERGDDTEIRIH